MSTTKLADIEAERKEGNPIESVNIKNNKIVVQTREETIDVMIKDLQKTTLRSEIDNRINFYTITDSNIRSKIRRIDNEIEIYKSDNKFKLHYIVKDNIEGFGFELMNNEIILYEIVKNGEIVSENYFDNHPYINYDLTDIVSENVLYDEGEIYYSQSFINSLLNYSIDPTKLDDKYDTYILFVGVSITLILISLNFMLFEYLVASYITILIFVLFGLIIYYGLKISTAYESRYIKLNN